MALDLIQVYEMALPDPPVCTTPVNPPDGATNIEPGTIISWDAVNNANGYLIFLGTDYPPQNMENGTDLGNATTYAALSALAPNTIYYWRVVPYGAGGNAPNCDTWSFTTSDVPDCTSPLFPADGANDVSVNTVLTWDPVSGASGYLVFFGTDDPPSNIQNGFNAGMATWFEPGFDLGYQTTYHWQIIPFNNSGNALGCGSWSFITEAAPPPPFYPYTESFENGLGIWTQMSGDDFDWTRLADNTPTQSTGPSQAANGNYFLYTEASGNNAGDIAILQATFDFSSLINPHLEFAYHMYGDGMGSLHLDVHDGNSWVSDFWMIGGEQNTSASDNYNTANISLSGYSGLQAVSLRFRGIRGPSEFSDLAIDQIHIAEGQGGNALEVGAGLKSDNIEIFTHAKKIYFRLPPKYGKGTAWIYDLTGHMISTVDLQQLGGKGVTINQTTGYYVVKAVVDQEFVVRKVLLF
jgi:hypothetical protein